MIVVEKGGAVSCGWGYSWEMTRGTRVVVVGLTQGQMLDETGWH